MALIMRHLPLLLALAASATAFQCRQAPKAATPYCGLPYELSNWQGERRSRLT